MKIVGFDLAMSLKQIKQRHLGGNDHHQRSLLKSMNNNVSRIASYPMKTSDVLSRIDMMLKKLQIVQNYHYYSYY